MRILQFGMSLILLIAVTIGCTKDEINFDRPSHGQLTDSLGNCLPKIIEGTYNSGITFTSDNFIDVYTNIDTIGKYEIFTDTVNGVSFYGTGRLGEKGENRVRIYGSGRPLSGGTFTFTVKYGASRCKVPIKFEGLVIPPAAFTYTVEAGACAGAVLAGTYSTNIATTADNKVTLKVNVTTAGLYNISTAAVNGVTFSASGSFTSTGAQTVVLKASGVPVAAGSNNYTVTAGSSSCTFSVTTEKGPDAAVFTLGGSPSACSGFVAAGTYKAGTALTTSNTVTTKVVVTAIGAYNITTNTVNGMSFSASGTFTATGEQSVTLKGTGTPTTAGSNNFTATAGTSTCTFSITTSSGSGTPTADCKKCSYVPLCEGARYSYTRTFNGVTDDLSVLFKIIKDTSIGGKVFVKMDDTTGAKNYSYYNCTSGVTTLIAYQATSVGGTTVSKIEQTLLKANEAVGATWVNTLSLPSGIPGVTQTAIYNWSIGEKGISVTVNGLTFNDVIRVHLVLEAEVSGVKYESSQSDYYYANGVGLIKVVTTNSMLGGIESLRQEIVSYYIP